MSSPAPVNEVIGCVIVLDEDDELVSVDVAWLVLEAVLVPTTVADVVPAEDVTGTVVVSRKPMRKRER